jgi:RNA polymerase sigma factor (sigma-70 family)
MFPQITRQLRIAFRHWNRDARDEAVQEGVASAAAAFRQLWLRGKVELAYATVLARYAARQMRAGRQMAGRLNIKDVTARHCQHRKGVVVERLDRFDPKEGCWREILVEDRNASPAEIAAIRIDFAEFLRTLTKRERRIALKLVKGESTGAVAGWLGVSPSRISQIRRELLEKWQAFQGETLRLVGASA